MEDTLEIAPFPPLTWRTIEDCWMAAAWLPGWSVFEEKDFRLSTVFPDVPDGAVLLRVIASDREKALPSEEQIAAYQDLLNNSESILQNILEAVFEQYPTWQEEFGLDEEEAEQFMPDLTEADQLKKLISLPGAYVHTVNSGGIAYIGFSFACTWDDEHALGIMTHAGRIVDIGGADTSFLTWIAEKDRDKVD